MQKRITIFIKPNLGLIKTDAKDHLLLSDLNYNFISFDYLLKIRIV